MYLHSRRSLLTAALALASGCAVPSDHFDRSGKTLYVNVQHAGGVLRADLTVAITRSP